MVRVVILFFDLVTKICTGVRIGTRMGDRNENLTGTRMGDRNENLIGTRTDGVSGATVVLSI